MKIIYEKGDKVFCNFGYRRNNKYYSCSKAIGEIIKVSISGYDIEFICHDGIKERRFKNSFHLEPVIERTKNIMNSLSKEIENKESILKTIKGVIYA